MRVIWIIAIEASIVLVGAAIYLLCGDLPSFRSAPGVTARGPIVVILSGGSSMGQPSDEEDVVPIDPEPRLDISFSQEASRFGIACRMLKDPVNPDQQKRLTASDRGETNDTSLRIDGNDFRFGRVSKGTAEFAKEKDERTRKIFEWKERAVSNGTFSSYVTKMVYKEFKVIVTQEVSYVVGETTRLYDTVLVKYSIENADTEAHRVGLRFLLDTCVGSNNGVPFEVGPSKEVKEVTMEDTFAVYEGRRVPTYLRAIENATDLESKSTTVGVVGLAIQGFAPIDHVVLCRPCEQPPWDWKYEPINADPENPDSCVVLYWSEKHLAPNERRICGFTYGLDRMRRARGCPD